MSQSIPDRQSQEQDNHVKDNEVGRDLIIAPVQNIIGTQIIQSSLEEVTKRELNKNSPYQGLKKFNLKDKDRFFGRDKFIAELLNAVKKSTLSVVLGASGSGKSSVVSAGLIPALKKSLESQTFYNFIFTPNKNPFDSLYYCLRSPVEDYSFTEAEAEIAQEPKADTLTKLISALRKNEEHWLIFVDQFEELFTICADSDKRDNFISSLVQVAKSGNSSVKIVLAMRSDFLEQFSFYSDLGNIAGQNNLHLVTEMYPDELRLAIEQPAARNGVVFETGLVEQIIKDVEKQKGYLPLLQYTLNLLWVSECKTLGADGRPDIEDRTLNRASYAALDGVRGALQKRVNEIYSTLNQDEQTSTKQIFLKLVNIVDTDSGSRPVSRRAYRKEFVGESVESLLSKFTKESLLVTSNEYSSSEKLQVSESDLLKQSATVEIAHEILLSSWQELKSWIEEEKEAIMLKHWLADETNRWERIDDKSKANEELLKGSRLDLVVEFRDKDAFKNIGGLRTEENQFIDASVKERERIKKESEEQQQRELKVAEELAKAKEKALQESQKRNKQLGCLLLVAIGFGLMAWKKTQQAELNLADARGFSSLALFDKGKELDAFIEAIKAGKILQKQHEYNPIVMNALQKAIYEGSQLNEMEGHKGKVSCVSFSPDGNIFATGSYDTTSKLWDVKTGKEILTLKGHHAQVTSISFSPDGNILATSSTDMTSKLWDAKTGDQIHTLKGSESEVYNVSFSPDGNILATGINGKIKLWNVKTGEEIRTLNGHDSPVHSMSSNPQSNLLGADNRDNSISFSPDGKILASGSKDGTIKLWNIQTAKEILILKSNSSPVLSVNFSPDSKILASADKDSSIKLWNVGTGKKIRTINGHEGKVYSVSFSPDGQTLASGSSDKTIKLWNVGTGKKIRTINGHEGEVLSASFSPDGKILATGSADNTIKLWKVDTSQEIRTLKGHYDSVLSVSFSPDNKMLASSIKDKTIKLWKVDTGQEIRSFKSHESDIYSASFSPDNKILASSSGKDNTIKLWKVDTGEEIHSLNGHNDLVFSISFSPDGNTLATGSADNTIKLWDVKTGQEIPSIKEHNSWVLSISFSPDGKTLATGSADTTIKLWNVKTGREIRSIKGHESGILSISFSPDGKTLATGSADTTIKLWDVKTGQEIRSIKGHEGGVLSISFSPDGKTLATGSTDMTIKLWPIDLNLDSLIRRSCNLVRHYLTNNPKVNKSDDGRLCDGIFRE